MAESTPEMTKAQVEEILRGRDGKFGPADVTRDLMRAAGRWALTYDGDFAWMVRTANRLRETRRVDQDTAAKILNVWKVSLAPRRPAVSAPAPQPSPAAAASFGFTPTAEQAECVRMFETGLDLVIQAGAGAGKTSTLKLIAANAQARGLQGTYTAFNKAIVTDTKGSMPGNVECATMHSLAFRAVGHQFADRLRGGRQSSTEIARTLGIREHSIAVGTEIKRLAPAWLAGKAMGMVKTFCASTAPVPGLEHWAHIPGLDQPGYYENNVRVAQHLLPFAVKAWADLCDPDGSLRFVHDHYLKMWALDNPVIPGDFLLFDEAQDADPVQAQIVEAQKARGTQVVVVGDEMQVIYEWRGAVNAMADFEKAGAQVAFLSQSFRFGPAIADVANGLLGRLEARLRIEGSTARESTVGPAERATAVLCRTNAGAVKVVLNTLAERNEDGTQKRPHLVGSADQIIAFCKAALDLQAGRPTYHPELAIFGSWTAVQEYVAADEDGADLELMVKLIDEFGAQTIIDALESQPAERDADLVVSTAHKSKGREWDVVRIGRDFFPPKDGGDLAPAELRLAYVAATRAKLHLDISAVPHFGPEWTPKATAGPRVYGSTAGPVTVESDSARAARVRMERARKAAG